MGLFLSMSSVVGGRPAEVEACIRGYVEGRGGEFERAAVELAEDREARMLASSGGVTVVYPDEFYEWNDLSATLSAHLRKPTFSFHIHDGDLWMFLLFVEGNEVARFNPIPDYWEELDPAQRSTWLPGAEEIAKYVDRGRPEELAPYFVEWPEDELPGKAHEDDEFGFVDWQLVDFMRRLGFEFPDVGQGVSYQFRVGRER